MFKAMFLGCFLILSACHDFQPRTIERVTMTDDGFDARFTLWSDVAKPSVRIICGGGTGSGVVVRQNKEHAYILTAAHVVCDHLHAPVATCDVDRHDATLVHGEVWKVNAALDLAIIRTAPVWRAAARLATLKDTTIGWGSSVVAFGHPLGVPEGVLTDGRITSVDDEGQLRYSCPTFFGNSGGGIFAEQRGRWVLISICQNIFVAQGPMGEKMPYPSLGRGARPDVMMTYLDNCLKGEPDVR